MSADVVREALNAAVVELMELEVSELIGAQLGERRPEERATRRNGYRARRWDTRAGEVELHIPKIRHGSYYPSFLEPRRRSAQALLAVVQQAYVCGVSTPAASAKRLEGDAGGESIDGAGTVALATVLALAGVQSRRATPATGSCSREGLWSARMTVVIPDRFAGGAAYRASGRKYRAGHGRLMD